MSSNPSQSTSAAFTPVPPAEAFRRLKEGNHRFVNHIRSIDSIVSQTERSEMAKATQRPFAIVLCCSDSRAPAELIFDQGLGDLFVVRVAGNVIAPSLVGSVEFAAVAFDSRLVVVMGHTGCGAVSATIDSLQKGSRAPSENIQDIIQRITPQIEGLVHPGAPKEALMQEATRANVRASVSQLKHGSRILEDLVNQGKLKVIGAEYCLESGKVEFLEEVRS